MSQNYTEETKVRKLSKLLIDKGFKVRRENLSRGSAFRVKSGDCTFTGDKYLFVDKRLQPDQQYNIIVDFISANRVEFQREEISFLTESEKAIFNVASLVDSEITK